MWPVSAILRLATDWGYMGLGLGLHAELLITVIHYTAKDNE